jgi:protocatechuate 3,4-dioxygenase beta subunit
VYSYDYTPTERSDKITITAVYAGVDDEVAGVINSTWILAEPHTTEIVLDFVENVPINATTTISGRVIVKNNDTKLNGSVLVTVGDEDPVSVDLKEGVFTYEYSQETIETAIPVTVVYSGTPAYDSSINSTTFDVEPLETDLTVSVEINDETGDEIIISGTLNDELGNPLNAIITVEIVDAKDGQVLYTNDSVAVENGKYNLTYGVSPEKVEYNITALYDGVENVYLDSEAQTTYVPELIPTTVKIDRDPEATPMSYYVDENITVKGNLTDKYGRKVANAKIDLYLEGQLIGNTTTDENGEFVFTDYVLSQDLEFANLTAKFNDTEVYVGDDDSILISVDKRDTVVTIDPLENGYLVTENVTISGTVTEKYHNDVLLNGTADILINGVKVTSVPVTDGKYAYNYTFTPDDLGDDTSIDVVFTPSSDLTYKYDGNNNSTIVGVEKLTPKIEIDPIDDQRVNEPFNVTGTIKDNLGNPVKNTDAYLVLNDGTEVPIKTDDQGKFSTEVTTDTAGLNNITVGMEENDYCDAAEEDANFTADDRPISNITVDPIDELKVNKTTNVTGKVVDEHGEPIGGVPVTVTVNGKEFNTTTNPDGTFSVPVTPTTAGPTNVTVEVPTSEEVIGGNNTQTVDVEKQNPAITIDPIKDPVTGKPTNVTGTVKDENGNPVANQPVNVVVNGQTIPTTTDKDGKFSVPVTPKDGANTVTVSVPESGVYAPTNVTQTFVAEKIGTKIINLKPSNQFPVVSEPVTITGNLVDENNNPLTNTPVTVKVGDKTFTTTTGSLGKFSVSYTPTEVAKGVNITASYAGNNTHLASTNKTWMDVEILGTNVTVNPITNATAGNPVTVSGTVKDERGNPVANQPVIVTVDGVPTEVKTDSNGKFSTTFTPTESGTTSVNVKYPGDETHQEEEVDMPVTVNKQPTKVTADPVTDATAGVNKDITGKVTDGNGKPVANMPVQVNVNGKQYPTTTDSNGNYKVTANNVAPGTNNVTTSIAGDKKYAPATQKSTFTAKNPVISLNNIPNAAPGDNVTISGKLVDANNKPLANQPVTVKVNNKEYNTTTNANGEYSIVAPSVSAGTKNVTATFKNVATNKSFKVEKLNVNVTVPSVVGKVGEKITLTAKVYDEKGNPVTSGNIVFKLNGRSLRTDGRFDTNTAPALKINVVNGVVTYNMTADLYLRYGKNITASYSGSFRYNQANGNTAEANIQLRDVKVRVNAKPSSAKQNTDVIFTAYAYDVTKNAKNNTIINENATMMFKVNGKTLTDSKGKAIKVKVVNGSASYAYHIDRGVGGIDNNKNVRNYTVTAVYSNSFFYPENNKNSTNYTVQRSPITINIKSATVKNNMLTVKANITDYQGALVVGTNKVCIKVNGATYKENGEYKYWSVKNGMMTLSGIKVSSTKKVTKIEIVTGERQAYLEGRQTSTNIVYS